MWAGNTGSIPSAGNGTCGTTTPANTLSGAGFNSSYQYTHLGQFWQGPLNGTGGAQQYLYCDSTHPHQLTGLYPLGTTCSTKGSATPSYTAGYDAWGNQTSRSYNSVTATLSYDIQNQLVEWNAGSTNQGWYAYDSDGQRVLQRSIATSGTSITVYAFGIEEHLYSGNGISTSNLYYYPLDGKLIGSTNGTSTQFYLTDALGSVLESFSDIANTASVLGNQAFGPYGTIQYQSGSIGTNQGFTDQYQDASGLDYDNTRYYDPVVGQFISADRAENNQDGTNPYAYVDANPETFVDPSGQRPIDEGGGDGGDPCASGGCSGVQTWGTPNDVPFINLDPNGPLFPSSPQWVLDQEKSLDYLYLSTWARTDPYAYLHPIIKSGFAAPAGGGSGGLAKPTGSAVQGGYTGSGSGGAGGSSGNSGTRRGPPNKNRKAQAAVNTIKQRLRSVDQSLMEHRTIAAGIIEGDNGPVTVIAINQIYTPAKDRGKTDPTADEVKKIVDTLGPKLGWTYIGPDTIGPPPSDTFRPNHAEDYIIDYGEAIL